MTSTKVYEKRVNGKRPLETAPSTSDADGDVRFLCNLDLDILKCPIYESLYPPVFQCPNGHSLCSLCRAGISKCPFCSQSVGISRNLLAEKILESLEVRCKHAPYGCKQMLKYSTRENHFKNLCAYRACPCPIPECNHEGPKRTLPQHLEIEHHVVTIPLTLNTTPQCRKGKFQMAPTVLNWNPLTFELLKVDQKVKLLFHKEAIKTLGYLIFCTTFEDKALTYDLEISSNSDSRRESCTKIANASAEDMLQRENWKRDDLIFYTGGDKASIVVAISLHTDIQL